MEWLLSLLTWAKGINLEKQLTLIKDGIKAWRENKDLHRARGDQDRLVRFSAAATELTNAPSLPGNALILRGNAGVISTMERGLKEGHGGFKTRPDLDEWSDIQQQLKAANDHIVTIVESAVNSAEDFIRIGGQELLVKYFDLLGGRIREISHWLNRSAPTTKEDKALLSKALKNYNSLRKDTISLNEDLARLLKPALQRRYGGAAADETRRPARRGVDRIA